MAIDSLNPLVHRFRLRSSICIVPQTDTATDRRRYLERHRLSRTHNRHLNAALHRIARTQARHCLAAQAFLARRTSSGDSSKEALRILNRLLSDAFSRPMQVDLAHQQASRSGPETIAVDMEDM